MYLDTLGAREMSSLVQSCNDYLSTKAAATLKPRAIKEVDSILTTLKLIYQSNTRSLRIPASGFVNPAISQRISITEEFRIWKQAHQRRMPLHKRFTFLSYPFVLDLESKAKLIQMEHTAVMSSQMNSCILNMLIQGVVTLPYLSISVRREHIVQDTIEQLLAPGVNLKKPLKVSFVGEEGVDEGGLRKEFFQLATRQLIHQRFGMFEYRPDERVFWFNPFCGDSGMNY